MSRLGTIARTLAVLGAGAAGAYGAYAVAAWYRYGRTGSPGPPGPDRLLDAFLPVYEVAEHQSCRVAAPATLALAAADTVLAGRLRDRGWGLLGESPGREIALGAVTRPRAGKPEYRAVPAAAFAAFAEPGYVKIVLALVAEPRGPAASTLRIEIRAATTDHESRERFRRYWSAFAAGVRLIRAVLLRRARREAERRAGAKPSS